MIKKFNKMDNSKKIPIVLILATAFIVFVILYSYFSNKNNGYEIKREDDSKAIVYTADTIKNDIFFMNIPYINIDNSFIKGINEEISSYAEEFYENEEVRMSYEYDVNGKVLSLVIKTVDYDTEDVPLVYFKTYNINLETNKLVSAEELLNIYGLTLDDVSSIIEKKFMYFYNDLIEKEYFDEEECDYECFLGNRDVEDYNDNISFYIEKGKLIVFKPFVFHSIIGEEGYFKEKDFKFVLDK